jgi:hypothetical protein
LDSDGGAKISFDKLPPDLQKRFGYNPQNAAAYAQNQAAQNQIDQLTEENAKLRSALSRYKGAFEETQATPKVGIEAFHVYLYQTVVSFPIGSYARRNDVLTDGPWAGLTQDEAMTKAQQQWTQMSDDQKAPYEKMAQQTGDPILQKRADDAAKPAQFIPGPIIEN